jgi:hypothetical protein
MPIKISTGAIACATLLLVAGAAHSLPTECDNWQTKHPDWLWCDDFESDSSLEQNYFDVNRVGGRFGVSNKAAFGGSNSLKGSYAVGQSDAGGVKLSLGKTPVYPKRYTDRNFTDLYWRFYMKTAPNWVGQPMKVTRATIFTNSNWAQAAIGHLWEDSLSSLGLGMDPVSGVSGSTVVTTKWNDFNNMKWLGKLNGKTQVYSAANRDKWQCIEVHMKLNTPGQSDGVFAFWVNGQLEAQKTGLNWRGSYTTYGINAITLENWINDGPPQNQDRFFDNFVVSTQPIGCYNSGTTTASAPVAPTNVTAVKAN